MTGQGGPRGPRDRGAPCGRRDHGGNLAAAIARFGGARAEWLDLSTGINPVAWPVGELDPAAWTRLPEADAELAFLEAAREAYAIPDESGLVAVPGLSAAIRALPRLDPALEVAIPQPTYNEHAAAWADAGWRVVERPSPATRAAVIVNPNNPDGRIWERHELLTLAEALPRLVVDESFVEVQPQLSLADELGRGPAAGSVALLRSFGKFFGLAGLRLGVVAGPPRLTRALREALGPWSVSGPALEIGTQALLDAEWQEETRQRLQRDLERLKRLGRGRGWRLVGAAGLFATFDTGDAAAWQDRLARARIWTRAFPWSDGWLRLGLPADDAGWRRLGAVLSEAGRERP